MLHGSASAPVLAAQREPQGYAHSERVTRKVPPLALVPLDQLQRLRERQKKQEEELEERPARRRRQREEDGRADKEQAEREEQHQRLGERFLGMMALLARLKRMDLDEESSQKEKTSRRSPLRSSRSATAPSPQKERPKLLEEPKPTAYELLVQKKKAERSRGVALTVTTDGGGTSIELSPHRKPEPVVNVATAPLREHLTFEISMLLPQPIDTRQSALESPIRRKKRRRRLRRKKRLLGATMVDGRRTWSTSHVTWVPHASADYAKARLNEAVAAQGSSKLVAKFAALKTAATAEPRQGRVEEPWRRDPFSWKREEQRHSTQSLHEPTPGFNGKDEDVEHQWDEENNVRYEAQGGAMEDIGEEDEDLSPNGDSSEEGTERSWGEEENEEENIKEGDEKKEDGGDEEEDYDNDALPELMQAQPLNSTRSSAKRPPLRTPATVSVVRPLQTHQAAWISPELRRWLVGSGLFRTASKSPPSASC